jgi:GGDEF domain-containing protein
LGVVWLFEMLEDYAGPLPATTHRKVPAPVHEATRRLLTATSTAEVTDIARDLVLALGGGIFSSFNASGEVLPIDISLGGEGFFAGAAPGTEARRWLQDYLPGFIADARSVIDAQRTSERLARDAGVDAVTGLADRSAIGRLVTRLEPGDLLVAISLNGMDRISALNDRAMAENLLRAFARALRQATRANENCARIGGDQFLVVLYQADEDCGERFLSRLRARWADGPRIEMAFSAGVASVDEYGWRPAMLAADRALQRSRDGGGEWEIARPEDYS